MAVSEQLKKISDSVWELPASYKEGMRVPARIVATEKLVREMDEAVYEQISNVATLPGIARYALCMPDGHSGYGFPIGGVAAMDVHEGGVISPGGIGFDINCGMRLVITNLTHDEVQPHLHQIVDRLYEQVPAGVGSHRLLKVMESKYRIKSLDRELACAPFDSPEGHDYFAAMKCGLNMSFANRQVILHRIREVFSEVFGRTAEDLGMQMIYDVAHNTAKLEQHVVDGKEKKLLIHRKGATRAFGPGHDEVASRYRGVGQPVIIGGSMETGSYLLVGTASGAETFFSTAHGSGRTMSRTKARKQWHGKQLQRDLEARGIYVRSTSWAGLAEEAGPAYKDIDEVIAATEQAGISKPVVRFTPIGNVKG